MNHKLGARRFSFAVVTDTHLNRADDDSNSPFDVNRRANNRLRCVINDLNRRDLSFVIHLGDVVHPVPSMEDLYAESAARFFEQMAALNHPFHLIPGNHDVGDKPLDWGPAGGVCDSFLNAWQTHFGAQFFDAEHDGIHVIGINAQVLGSGLALEAEQDAWLREHLDACGDKRIFLASHYPPFLLDADEAEHYDNLGAPARDRLLRLLQTHPVEGLFCGHVHQFWYHRIGQTDCYLLPSTAFTRQDYAEMFRVAGDDEFGRNDTAKLGYLLVHVHDHGHDAELIRTAGCEDPAGPPLPSSGGFMTARSPFGIDLRHDWMETVQIPPSGGLDEFDRKSVRNDYGLLALLESGIRRLRLPLTDFVSAARRRRLSDIRHFGFRYRFYSFGCPASAVRKLIERHPDLVDEWEICCRIEHFEQLDQTFLDLARLHDINLIYSPLRSKADMANSGKKYYHVINHGFTAGDNALIDRWTLRPGSKQFGGVLLRLAFDDPLATTVEFAAAVSAQHNKRCSVLMRLSDNNPAACHDDDAWLCTRLTAAAAAAATAANGKASLEFFIGGLNDQDRGYLPCGGLVDRRYNPRAGMAALHRMVAGGNVVWRDER